MTRSCVTNDFEFARRSHLRRVFLCARAVTLALAFSGIAAALPTPASAAEYRVPRKELGFPVYTNAPLGRQLGGTHVPAATPALSPEEAQRKFTLPEGFEIRLFASEPEVVNPVAMTWDERGRLWVVELYEYPLGAKPGEKPRDRIKILEDTDADGHADQVTVWADGLNLAPASCSATAAPTSARPRTCCSSGTPMATGARTSGRS